MSFLIGLSGGRGSGKTWLAGQLATAAGFSKASFGDVVRAEAGKRGVVSTTENLQALGAQLFDLWGPDRFAAEAISKLGSFNDGIVEGIRHSAVLESIKLLGEGRHVVAVFLDIADNERRRRLWLRDGDDGRQQDDRGVERELQDLRARADVILDGADLDGASKLIMALQRIDPEWQPYPRPLG